MYTELTSTDEAEGKTVQGITRAIVGDQMVVAFTDGTFLPLGVVHGYDDDCVGLQEFDFMDFGAEALLASGIITEEERAQKVTEHYAYRLLRTKAAERRRYELLKAKFEGEQ